MRYMNARCEGPIRSGRIVLTLTVRALHMRQLCRPPSASTHASIRIPLAPGPEHIEDGADLPNVHRPRPAATLRRAINGGDQGPFSVRQIALLRLPHEAPFPESDAA